MNLRLSHLMHILELVHSGELGDIQSIRQELEAPSRGNPGYGRG
jgi:hypothetical protein